MDASLYKTHTTSRGIKYKYYFSPAQSGQRTLLFLHGYPSTSDDWHRQVPFFKEKGYGILVPDMLGYGGTDKPTREELDKFGLNLIAQDMIDLLEHEKVGSAVSIAHDWGAAANSRVATLFQDRFDGFANLAVGYIAPSPDANVHQAHAMLEKLLGWPVFGYQMIHAEAGAADLIESHWDSYFSLLYPSDPALWKTNLGPIGGLREWLEQDRRSPLPSYLTEADKERLTKAIFDNGGLRSPLLWYNYFVDGLTAKEAKTIPEDKYKIDKPFFLGATLKDYVCVAPAQIMGSKKWCTQLTIKGYDGDHWAMWSHADAINRDLLEWLEGLPKA